MEQDVDLRSQKNSRLKQYTVATKELQLLFLINLAVYFYIFFLQTTGVQSD